MFISCSKGIISTWTLHFPPFTFVKIKSTLFLCLAASNSYAVCCVYVVCKVRTIVLQILVC